MYDGVRSVIEPKWSLEILLALQQQSPRNYSAVEAQFDTSSDVISDRLHLLTEYALIERRERTPRDVQYLLTERGENFLRQVSTLEELLSGVNDS